MGVNEVATYYNKLKFKILEWIISNKSQKQVKSTVDRVDLGLSEGGC